MLILGAKRCWKWENVEIGVRKAGVKNGGQAETGAKNGVGQASIMSVRRRSQELCIKLYSKRKLWVTEERA